MMITYIFSTAKASIKIPIQPGPQWYNQYKKPFGERFQRALYENYEFFRIFRKYRNVEYQTGPKGLLYEVTSMQNTLLDMPHISTRHYELCENLKICRQYSRYMKEISETFVILVKGTLKPFVQWFSVFVRHMWMRL